MKGNLLFVGGDLSGIQKFIYNITSKRAMVSLKGRSNYLKTFTEDVCNDIMNIPEIMNSGFDRNEMKIYCSGGKFYLQVPDSDAIRTGIKDLREKVEKKLWKEHHGQLSINIDYVPFVYDGDLVKVDGETDNIGLLWTKVNEKFNALKNQKFKSLLLNQYQDFFEVQKVGGEGVKVCQITGIEGAKEYTMKFKDEDGEKEEVMTVLPSVKAQIDLGCELRDKQHFKMLEDYAGDTYLGILRMDVDGLGARFIKGFESMEKYKEFSGKLDKFFDSDNGNLRAIQEQYKEYMNIVYAGGDDIFAVGRWDKVIEFATDVREQFAHYCNEALNDSTLTISGGVAIVNKKFPIAKAAEMAGDAEDAAKKYNNGKKNAFNMFGESISWNGEFDYVKKYKDEFATLIDKCGLSRSILHKVMTYAAIIKNNQIIEEENKKGDNKRKPNMSYLWHAAYYLTRFMGKEQDNKVVYDFCKDLRDVQLVKTENYRLISLSARWAELELRMNKNSKNNKNQ